MSNPYLVMVNQRLAYARIQLGIIVDVRWQKTVISNFERPSLLYGALFHLVDAYSLYLREITFNYKQSDFIHNSILQRRDQPIKPGSVPNAGDLCSADQAPAEVKELLSLENKADSWLGSMLHTYAVRLEIPERMDVTDIASKSASIPLVDVTSTENRLSSLTSERLESWLQAMRELVDRQRETMFEC